MKLRTIRAHIRAVGIAAALLALAGGCGEDEGLKVFRVSPALGTYMGGDTATIHGSGFQKRGIQGVRVYFGNEDAKVLSFDGDDKLRVRVPAGEIGKEVDVSVVFDNGGSITIPKAYKYIDPKPLKVDDLTDKGEGN